MVMKGQANSLMYPHPEHRSPGDIDCYLFENYQLGNIIAKKEGAIVDEGWYKHSQISYKGELFENHLFFVHTREGKRSKRLQKELERYGIEATVRQSFGKSIQGACGQLAAGYKKKTANLFSSDAGDFFSSIKAEGEQER